jgi:diaminohydroxyphosphoribosylaminopyrimidine deaminase / 5-amino-6-(5-phosphoribosylamino)uracil reductase
LASGSTGNTTGVTRAFDTEYIRRALANAAKGWGQTAPNPMVGAVVVSGGEVVADGWHRTFGGPHAEVNALQQAEARAYESTMYVTLEPCTHHGKTPPCTDAIIAAGVTRVVIAVRDPNPLAKGGVEKLRAAGIQVDVGVEAAQAIELNAPFFNAFVSDRPWVTLKLAVSADGAVADPTGAHRWITGEESRREVHRMRAGVDAVAVGIGTVLADDPELTVRDADAPRRQPKRVIFDSRLRTPLTAAVVRGASVVPTVIVTRDIAPDAARPFRDRGVEVIAAPNLGDALRALRSIDIRSLLVEGGPKLAGSFISEGLVDRLALFEAPLILGPAAPAAFASAPARFSQLLRTYPLLHRRLFGKDTLTIYAMNEGEALGS